MSGVLKKVLIGVAAVAVPAVSFFAYGGIRYLSDISKSLKGQDVQIIVEDGDTAAVVGEKLANFGWVSSKKSFELYSRLNKKADFKTGVYVFEEALTIPEIADKIISGESQKKFSVTFLPGGTIMDAKNVLVSAGFSDEEVSKALSVDYSKEFPKLFDGKPASADLEGYFYGETHIFDNDVSAEEVLRRFFADFEEIVVAEKLAEKYKAKNLTLYEGLILASIIQRESVGCGAAAICEDQRSIAGVFFNRIAANMNLGSDVTYQYIADKTNIERDTELDSPYNLRVHSGLTPTPISTPSHSALEAVANPTQHNYLFFLSGDDDKTYFGETVEEHEENARNHCQEKCKII